MNPSTRWLQGKALLHLGILMLVFGLLQIFFSSQAAAESPQLAHWRLDEPGGPIYKDLSQGRHATCVGDCPTATGGQIGGAQRFNGSSTGLDVTAHASFDWNAADSFSVELWVQGTAGQTCADSPEVMIGRADPSTGLRWSIGCASATGRVLFQLTDESGHGVTLEGTAIHNGVWHHIVGVRDGVNNRNLLYVDGTEVAATPITYAAGFASGTGINIGWLNFSDSDRKIFKGFIDEVAIYDRVLSSTEIEQHYTAGIAGNGIESLRPAPVANAGNAQTVDQKAVVSLNGSLSEDTNGVIVAWKWDQLLPSLYEVDLENANQEVATFDAPDEVGTDDVALTFQLTVTDHDGLQNTDTTTVTAI